MRYWGYVHNNGNIQVKPFFDEKDIDLAEESDFVFQVFRNIEANNREEAYAYIEKNQLARFKHNDGFVGVNYASLWGEPKND